MKALGRDIKEFYDNHWPVGYYHDENELDTHTDDGSWALDDNTKYELKELGLIIPEGETMGDPVTFASVFNRWFKTKTHATILLEVPVADKDSVIAQLKAMGLKVL
jgi:hypothetical protein